MLDYERFADLIFLFLILGEVNAIFYLNVQSVDYLFRKVVIVERMMENVKLWIFMKCNHEYK